MDSKRDRHRLSTLPEHLLFLIISKLPFKEAVKTSSEFVNRSVSSSAKSIRDARVAFIRFMVNWVSRFSGEVIESFHLCLSKPTGFETEAKHLIEFAISKQVQNLVLDLSNLSCTASNQARPAVLFQLLECVYNQVTVESLKLFACGFDPSRIPKPSSFKSLCFGWIKLGKITTLLSSSPLLERLSILKCWSVGLITRDRLRELKFENCDFAKDYTWIDLPNIQIFKYSGSFHYFQFLRVQRRMEEAYLDFGRETDDEIGTLICDLLYDLLSARKLMVCPFIIKAIKDIDYLVHLKAPMKTRHLVIKTNLVPVEFEGIRLMINSYPELETLTFHMLPPVSVARTSHWFTADTYWNFPICHKCLKKTLKVVEVRNFTGGTYESVMLRYLFGSYRVLERVDLYLPVGTSESVKTSVRVTMRTLGDEGVASSKGLWIRLHNG
ncbi:hypothetical protein Bca52824_016175 [Brassica carinata]|uniref:F-box domain-containing protein n=1 Tax=Brassica carinata TaxID=52824 RepID=A0A8X8B6D0_BRACI|nr:hypothetical protein Bca52824_016175 [Brassica carinata]